MGGSRGGYVPIRSSHISVCRYIPTYVYLHTDMCAYVYTHIRMHLHVYTRMLGMCTTIYGRASAATPPSEPSLRSGLSPPPPLSKFRKRFCVRSARFSATALLCPVVFFFRALYGRLKFTVRRHKFNEYSLFSLLQHCCTHRNTRRCKGVTRAWRVVLAHQNRARPTPKVDGL